MANRHFGEIGDVWKHLALAEILAIEQPQQYRESHAGSSEYVLTHSSARDYGVFHFLANCKRSPILSRCHYRRCLAALDDPAGDCNYPGSPYIALSVLGNVCSKFLFCGTDGESLRTIESRAVAMGFSKSDVIARQEDGIAALTNEIFPKSENAAALKTFVHLDPYDPFLENNDGLSCSQLFCRLGSEGHGVMFWYGFESPKAHVTFWSGMKNAISAGMNQIITGSIWAVEVSPYAISTGIYDDSGSYIGCGVLCCNLADKTFGVCRNLAMALGEIYENAVLPDGRPGKLQVDVREKIS
ncbi:MAG: hypothetical protein HZA50_02055 [Planctomycetes bacterium]|nr:hypothetical protein [Planctomycetota bacterium]